MKKRIIKNRFALFVFLICVVFFFTAYLKTSIYRNVEWSFDNGILTIYGEGEMYNYGSSTAQQPPWYVIKDEINRIVIKEGVTKIGKNSFLFCKNATEVIIGENVDAINSNAFGGCESLKKVSFVQKEPMTIDSTAFKYANNMIVFEIIEKE